MSTSRLRGPAAGPSLVGMAVIAMIAGVVRASEPLLSGIDAFWHWDMGRRIVRDGLISTDPYSFLTDGREWVLNQWGTEAVFGLLDRAGGLATLAIVVALLVAGAYLLTGWTMWQRSPSLLTVAAFGLVVIASMTNWALRGNLFTFFFLPLLLRELRREDGPRPLVVLGLVAVWANMHAAFLLGVLLVVVDAAARAITDAAGRARGRRGRLALTVVAAVTAGAATPYGPRFLADAVSLSLRAGRSGITEWAPTPLTRLDILPFTLLVALMLIGVGLAASRRNLSDVLMIVVLTLFGISAQRNVAAASIALGIVGAPYLRGGYVALRDRSGSDEARGPAPIDRLAAATLVTIGAIAIIVVVPWSNQVDAHVEGVPLGLIREIDALDRPARVMTISLWSAGVATLSDDDVRIPVDGRLELFTDEEFDDYRTVQSVAPGWDKVLERWCVTDALLPHDNAAAMAIAGTDEWSLAARGDVPGVRGTGTALWYVRREEPRTCTRDSSG